ncbi:hypothetical protein [Xanthomonas medicagonis]|uniref:hypothetical protein n=1 Tax=Xanthomonas medicagonis TaxID=3160841 RepID=UPI0035173FC5
MENPYQVPGHSSKDGSQAARGKDHTALSLIIAALCVLQFLGVCMVVRRAMVEYGVAPGAVAHKLVLPFLLALAGVLLVFRRRLAAVFFAMYLVMYLAEFGTRKSINVPTVVLTLVFLSYGLWLWKSGLLTGWPNIPVRDADVVNGSETEVPVQNFSADLANQARASTAATAASSSQRWMTIAALLLVCPQVLLTAMLAPTLFGQFRDGDMGALAYLSWMSPSIALALGMWLLLRGRRVALYVFACAVALPAFAYLQLHSPGLAPGLFIAGCAGVVGSIASYGSTKVSSYS